MQLSNEHTQFRKPKSRMLAITSIILTSLIILFCIIPIFWIIFMCLTDDEKILTDFGPSDLVISDVQRYRPTGLSYKFGYHVDNGKIPEYRNVPIRYTKPGSA